MTDHPAREGPRDIADFNPELRRQRTAENLIHEHGRFIEVPKPFMVHRGVRMGLQAAGYDSSFMLALYDGYSDLTVHIGRQFEKEAVQLLMPPAVNLVPNVGQLGERPEDQPGAIRRFISWILNRGGEEGEAKK